MSRSPVPERPHRAVHITGTVLRSTLGLTGTECIDFRQRRIFSEFVGTFVNPLILMSHGCAPEARALLVDWKTLRGRNVTNRDVRRTLLKHRRVRGLFGLLARQRIRQGPIRRRTLLSLRRLVNSIEIPIGTTRWSDYCAEEVDVSNVESWMVKRRTALEVLARTKPATLLDIGSNTGWFSKLAATNGARVTAFDVDEPSINKLYLNEEARRLGILPLSMDFRRPTPAYGLGLRCLPAKERFKAEMVFALAIVHHLVFSQKSSFKDIVDNLVQYPTRWLLVEFIPREDVHVARMYNDSFAWYTLDNFLAELRLHFSSVEVLPSNPEPRVLLLCHV